MLDEGLDVIISFEVDASRRRLFGNSSTLSDSKRSSHHEHLKFVSVASLEIVRSNFGDGSQSLPSFALKAIRHVLFDLCESNLSGDIPWRFSSLLYVRYVTMSPNKASIVAPQIEDEAFFVVDKSTASNNDGIVIFQHHRDLCVLSQPSNLESSMNNFTVKYIPLNVGFDSPESY
ncbi:hypothetical protein JHK82_031499 [Glycine max]|nr:hypothetical protein JHK82_031499 [Glycine max]